MCDCSRIYFFVESNEFWIFNLLNIGSIKSAIRVVLHNCFIKKRDVMRFLFLLIAVVLCDQLLNPDTWNVYVVLSMSFCLIFIFQLAGLNLTSLFSIIIKTSWVDSFVLSIGDANWLAYLVIFEMLLLMPIAYWSGAGTLVELKQFDHCMALIRVLCLQRN